MRRRHGTALVLAAALVVAAALAAGAGAAGGALPQRLAAALRAPGLAPARTSALVVDLRTGATVFAHRPALSLAPASTEKLVVTYAALARLGPAYRLRTEVLGRGRLVEGTWRGDLYLRGQGDPTLSAAGVEHLARRVAAWGIRRVSGRVLGDASRYDLVRDAPGWRPGFLGEESPPLTALAVDRAAGWPGLAPALLSARALDAALERVGVTVARAPRRGPAPADAAPLAELLSPPLAAIVRTTNRDSDNWSAELLLKELGAAVGDGGTTAAGAAVAVSVLREAGVPLAHVRIADGSGLSRLDRLSARTLVALLRAAERDPDLRDAFLGSLAVAGVNGTLEHRLERRPARGRVIAKTGTTRLSSALAGFVRGRYAFAVLQNGAPVPTATARGAQDRFAALLAAAP